MRERVRSWMDQARFELRKRTVGFEVPDVPHMDHEGRAFFEESLRAARRYLEYGSGGSTVMAARLGKRGSTIEGDRHYLRDVRRRIGDVSHGMELVHIDIGPTGMWGYPRFAWPTPWNVRAWMRYATHPFQGLGDAFFDLVLVDGRFRVACARASILEALKRKAEFRLLVDDYAERPRYRVIEEHVPLATMAGRMAVFEVTPTGVRRAPTTAEIRQAVRDVD